MIPFPDKKYQIILADPPWQIAKIKKRVRPNQIDMDYPMMSVKEIANLPVQNISDNLCILFLWTIDKYLPIGETRTNVKKIHWMKMPVPAEINKFCKSCEKTCKQSVGVKIVSCKLYKKKKARVK